MTLLYWIGTLLSAGLVLNVTPCVLPVLALKVLSLIKLGETESTLEGTNQKWATFKYCSAYAGGIIAAFGSLGIVIGIIKEITGVVFWGIQFQSPLFCLSVGVILLLMGLHYLGVFSYLKTLIADKPNFHISSFSRFTSWFAEKIEGLKKGYLSSFCQGSLTTLMASACSAPILATVLTFALSLSWYWIPLLFVGIGVGMAIPYFGFMFMPNLLKKLPKAGKWVTWITRISAAALIATAGWFFYLAI